MLENILIKRIRMPRIFLFFFVNESSWTANNKFSKGLTYAKPVKDKIKKIKKHYELGDTNLPIPIKRTRTKK